MPAIWVLVRGYIGASRGRGWGQNECILLAQERRSQQLYHNTEENMKLSNNSSGVIMPTRARGRVVGGCSLSDRFDVLVLFAVAAACCCAAAPCGRFPNWWMTRSRTTTNSRQQISASREHNRCLSQPQSQGPAIECVLNCLSQTRGDSIVSRYKFMENITRRDCCSRYF